MSDTAAEEETMERTELHLPYAHHNEQVERTAIIGREIATATGHACALPQDSTIRLHAAPSDSYVLVLFAEPPVAFTAATERDEATDDWLVIDEQSKVVWIEGTQIELSRKEYDAIVLLHRKHARLCSREELIASVWPEVFSARGVSDSAIDQLIHRIRRKIEPDPERPAHLISRKGFGYTLIQWPSRQFNDTTGNRR